MLAVAKQDAGNHPRQGYIGDIPIANLWLLMLYASDCFRALDTDKRDVEKNPDDIPDLVAEMLCHHVERRIKRNLSYGYQPREAILNRVRGRIDLLKTERYQLLNRGKVACRFDELAVNTPRNRYVRAALEEISKLVKPKSDLEYRCRSLAISLQRMGVIGNRPTVTEMAIDQFGRHDLKDRAMLEAAHLAFNLALPTEDEGSRHLSTPNRERKWIEKLFEAGVAGFYDVVLLDKEWSVATQKTIRWNRKNRSARMDDIFPTMRPDIVLTNKIENYRIVIDTKFTRIVRKNEDWHREESLISQHIYQIYAYVKSQEDNADDILDRDASGILLYPAIGEDFNQYAEIQNHQFRFDTVNLGGSAQDMREDLLKILANPRNPKE